RGAVRGRRDPDRGRGPVIPRGLHEGIPVHSENLDRVWSVADPVGPVTDILPRSAALVGAPIVGPEVASLWIAIVPRVGIRRRIVHLRGAVDVVVCKRIAECPDALRVIDLDAPGGIVLEQVAGNVGVERTVHTQFRAFLGLEVIVLGRNDVFRFDVELRPLWGYLFCYSSLVSD